MKTWYAAHIVMVVHFTRAKQTTYPAWENIVLIAAASAEDAYRKAEAYGAAEEGDDGGTFHWGNRLAQWKFAGIRKLTECRFLADEPCDLGEVTYLDLEFPSQRAVANYIAGNDQDVTIQDPFPEERASSATGQALKRPLKRKGA
jgi:hypothetical protein